MPHVFRTACLSIVGCLTMTGAHAQDMTGWPDWLIEAMAAEAGDLATTQVEIDAGPYEFTLPKGTTGPNAFDGGWSFETEISAVAVLECYVFTGDHDLATTAGSRGKSSIGSERSRRLSVKYRAISYPWRFIRAMASVIPSYTP